MTTIASRSAVARHAASKFEAQLLLARCRTGAEQALMPQGRRLAAHAQGLLEWLRGGGFHLDLETKTAASGRRFPVQNEYSSEECNSLSSANAAR